VSVRPILGLLLCSLVAAPAMADRYHRPLFRRQACTTGCSRITIEYDKADSESVADLDGNVALAATLARTIDEGRRYLATEYPIPDGPLAGDIRCSYDPYREYNRVLPITETIDVDDQPELVARWGLDAWARREVRRCLVQLSLYKRVKHRTSAIKWFLARQKFPNWLSLGLSAMESEPWSPEKMAVLLDGVEHSTLLSLPRYAYLKSFTSIEKYRAVQESQAFCQWLTELLGKDKVVALIDEYATQPTKFWAGFQRVTGMSGGEAHRLFLTAMLKYSALGVPTATEPERIFAEVGRLGKPWPSPDGRLLAFTSNHLRPHSENKDLFLSRLDGSRCTFGATDVREHLAWHVPSEGLFFIRDVVSAAGKRFNQLCWAPCTDPRGRTLVRRGLWFTVLRRGTRYSEVAVAPDGSRLSLLRHRPGHAEIQLFTIERGRGHPRLVHQRTIETAGVDHVWTSPTTIVLVRNERGSAQLVRLDVDTTALSILHSVSDRILDLSAAGSTLSFTVPFAEDRGVAVRTFSLDGPDRPSVTRLVVPRGCFRCSKTVATCCNDVECRTSRPTRSRPCRSRRRRRRRRPSTCRRRRSSTNCSLNSPSPPSVPAGRSSGRRSSSRTTRRACRGSGAMPCTRISSK